MGLDRSRVRVVLFDIDGTLRDTDDELVDRLANRISALVGHGRAHDVVRRTVMKVENPMQHLLSQMDRFNLDGPLHHLADRFSGGSDHATRLTPGAAEIVEALSPDYRLGVVSAGPAGTVASFLAEHHLDDAMDIVVTGRTCTRTKPHPMPINHAARVLAHNPWDVLMVGDTTVDIVAGHAAGAQTVGVLTGFGEREELEHAGADLIVDDLLELRKIFAR